MKRKRFTLFAVLVLLTVIFCSITVQAESYTYTNKKKVMELPIPYEVVATVSSSAEFISPVDMRVYDEHIYVLDSARKDITLIDENYNVLNRILFTKDGVGYEPNQLSAFYIFEDTFYVADYGKGCIFVADNKGNVLKEIFLLHTRYSPLENQSFCQFFYPQPLLRLKRTILPTIRWLFQFSLVATSLLSYWS